MPLQALLWEFRFPQFVERCRQRYGDTFIVNLPVSGKVVSICDPDLIRTVFADHGDRMHAGEANHVLEPALGSHSVLLLDGTEHMRQRRLMLPSFRGDRMQRYSTLMTDITAHDVDRWPLHRSLPLRPSMHAITLQVILRAVFGLREGAVLT